MRSLRSPLFWLLVSAVSFVPAIFEPIGVIREVGRFSFESRGRPTVLGKKLEICNAASNPKKSLLFDLRVTLKKLSGYQNVFQTASGNMGIRVELDETGAVGVVFRSLVPGQELAGVAAKQKILPGIPTRLQVTVDRASRVQIAINEQTPEVFSGVPIIDCDDVRVGVGFDSSRRLVGTVNGYVKIDEDQNVTYFGLPYAVRQLGQLIFLLSLLILIVVVAFERGRRQGQSELQANLPNA